MSESHLIENFVQDACGNHSQQSVRHGRSSLQYPTDCHPACDASAAVSHITLVLLTLVDLLGFR